MLFECQTVLRCYCLKCHWNVWRESFFALCKMEKFLTTKSKPKKERHLPVNITASKKARQYQRGTFHASENLPHLQCCVRSFKEICGRCRNLLATKSKNKIYKPYLHWFSEMNIGETWSFWLPSTWSKVSSKKKKQIVDIFGQKLIWWEVCWTNSMASTLL